MKNSVFTAVSCFYSDVSKRLRFETLRRREDGREKGLFMES